MKETITKDMEGLKDDQWEYVLEHFPEGFEYKQMQMIGLIALSPEFQKR